MMRGPLMCMRERGLPARGRGPTSWQCPRGSLECALRL